MFRDYPTGTDIPNKPTAVAGGTAPNTAAFSQTFTAGPADITQAGGLSPFGTMGQGGNVFEWMESAEVAPNDTSGEDRAVRGGVWYADDFFLRPSRQGEPAATGAFSIGFRVASKPADLRLHEPRRLETGLVVNIESNAGAVDVYRSTDLIDWANAPIGTAVTAGADVAIDPAPPPHGPFTGSSPRGRRCPDSASRSNRTA